MLGCLVTKGWHRVAPLLLLPGCLVSFNDYPLEASGGGAGQASGGSASAGSAGKVGTAGTATTAGSGGSGGNGDAGAGAGSPVNNAPITLIDDFEDGDKNILGLAGRSGAWYAANDGQGTQTPGSNMALVPSLLVPPRGESGHAAHTFGGPFEQWGALIGTSLASDAAYDVSGYHGIRFWVRSGAINLAAADEVRFVLPTSQTNVGGGCTVCNDHFGASVPLTPQWVRIELEFSDLHQEGYGVPKPPSPDLTRVSAIQFIFPRAVSFDLWVDDIELY